MVDLGCQKGWCSKGGTCSFEHDTAKKGKGKEHGSGSPVKRDTVLLKNNVSEKKANISSGKEVRPPCFNHKR